MAKKAVEVMDFAEPIKASIQALELEIGALEDKLAGVDEIYAELRHKKKQVAVLNQTVARLLGQPMGKNRPRGQNLSDITEHLSDSGGATVRDIAEATGINIPSVRYTLSRNPQFVRDEKNVWRVQEEG